MKTISDKDQLKIALLNVTHYKDMADYTKHENMTADDLADYIETGFIYDITPGLYNGATDEFYKAELTAENILSAIHTEVLESEFIDYASEYIDGETTADVIRSYTEIYHVFSVDGSLYVYTD